MTPTDAVDAVARHYRMERERLLSRWGAPSVSEPRIVLLVIWRRLGLTWDEVALRMGITVQGAMWRGKAVQPWHEEAADQIMRES